MLWLKKKKQKRNVVEVWLVVDQRKRTIQLDLLVFGFHNNDNITSQIDHSGGFQKGQVQQLEYITRVQDGFLKKSSRPQTVSASFSIFGVGVVYLYVNPFSPTPLSLSNLVHCSVRDYREEQCSNFQYHTPPPLPPLQLILLLVQI